MTHYYLNMTYEQFEEIITLLYNENQVRQKWYYSIPGDLSSSFVDNVYTNSLGICNDKLIDALFGKYAEDVFYFLYEDAVEGVDNVFVEDRSYCVHNLESYFEYAKKELKFKIGY